MDLKELIPFLRAHGVRKFRQDSPWIEIEFDAIATPEQKPLDVPPPPNMPVELRNPELMSMDQIRDWSGSPSESAAPLEGTDDVPLSEAV